MHEVDQELIFLYCCSCFWIVKSDNWWKHIFVHTIKLILRTKIDIRSIINYQIWLIMNKNPTVGPKSLVHIHIVIWLWHLFISSIILYLSSQKNWSSCVVDIDVICSLQYKISFKCDMKYNINSRSRKKSYPLGLSGHIFLGIFFRASKK